MRETRTQVRREALRCLLILCVTLVAFWNGRVWAQSVDKVQSQSVNPYNRELTKVQLEFNHCSPPKQAVLVARAYGLREFVDRTSDVAIWLTGVANNIQVHQLVRDEAHHYLAAIDIHNGDLDAAKSKYAELGVVRAWAVLEKKSSQQAESGGSEWGRLEIPASRLYVDLNDFVSETGAYAATSVYSETAQSVVLRFGADAEISVSVNGAEVFTGTAGTHAVFDQRAITVQFVAGWNSILVRLRESGNGSRKFIVRLTGFDGGGIQFKAVPGLNRTAVQNDISGTLRVPTDLIEMARAETRAYPNSAEEQGVLGAIELEHGRDSAIDHLEAAAHLEPVAENWLQVADACPDQACTFHALTAVLRDDADNEAAIRRFAEYYISRNQVEKAGRLLQKAVSLTPGDFVAQQELTDLYVSAGMNNAALRRTRELVERYPGGPLWLRKRIAEIYLKLGFLNDAKRTLQAVLREDNDDPLARKLADEFLQRTRGTASLELPALKDVSLGRADGHNQIKSSNSRNEDSDEVYLENAAELASSAWRTTKINDSDSIVLSDVRVERMASNGLSSMRIQQVIYIGTEQGARQYGSQTVQYSPASQNLQILHARVYKRDGRILEAQDGGDARVADVAVSMYYDARSREVLFPGIEKGDVVEFDYSITPTQNINPYGDYFGSLVMFRGSIPTELKRYVLITPSSRKINVVEKRMPSSAQISKSEGSRIYRWEVRDSAALPNESRGPSVTEIAPYVHVSTFGSWNELGHWYAEMIRPQFKTNDELRKIAVELTAGKKSEFDKINAIYQFVLRNTHYVAFEFGVYSYKPYPVTQVYERRFGDCKDKASLMIALLREAGIDADFALLRTRRMGEIDSRAASITLFNHAVVFLPKWNMWLDGTADYFSSGELPVEDQGAMALVVTADGAASMMHVPVTRPEDNFTRRTVRAVLANDGSIQFQGETYTRGEDAPGLRREYELPDRQRDSVRDGLAKVFPSVRVEDVHVQDGSGPEKFVNVDFRGTIDNFVGQRTVSLPTSWMQQSYLQRLAPTASRTQELILPAAWTREEELHFQLPSGADVVAMPANMEMKTQFGTVHIHYEKHGREIVIKTSLEFSTTRILPTDYAAFREFCRSVERAFRNEVKVAFRE